MSDTKIIPGPQPAIPKVGPIINIFKFFSDSVQAMETLPQQYGDLFSVSMQAEDHKASMVMAIGAEYNRQVLSQPDLFYVAGSLADSDLAPDHPAKMLAMGLPFLNDEPHHEQRRLVMPAFHMKHLQTYHEDMIEQTQRLLDSWQVGGQIDLHEGMTQLAMNIVIKTLFGLQPSQKSTYLGQVITEWLELLAHPLNQIKRLDWPGMPFRKVVNLSREIVAIYEELLAQKADDPDALDIMALLMQTEDESGQRLSNAQIMGHANTLFLAGHETSATTLTWLLVFLNLHPQVMTDVLEELERVLGGQPPRMDQLKDLTMLENVIKETLRLTPPLLLMIRRPQADFALGGYQMKAGSTIMISQYLTHRLPELYDEPYRFNPYRWQTIKPSPYEYFPFSAAMRRCAGAEFAMMEMKIALAMLLQRYKIEIASGTEVNYVTNFSLQHPQFSQPVTLAAQDGTPPAKVTVSGTIHTLVKLD